MADISNFSRLVGGIQRNVDMSANTLVVSSLKLGTSELTKAKLDLLAITADSATAVDASAQHHHDGRYFTETEIGAQTDGASGASLVGIDVTPAFTNFTSGNNVQSALEGIDTALATAGATSFDEADFEVFKTGAASNTTKFVLTALTAARTITMPDTNVDLGDIATNNAKVSADGSVTSHSDVTAAGSGIIISTAERSKLSGIEALADVTDATNVAAAGATMDADTDVSSNGWVVDEDNMASDLATKVPTQQSVKAYVDAEVASAVTSEMSFKGDYNAATNTPDLDTTPIATAIGDMYAVTVAGTFFTTAVEAGDVLIAKQATATLEAHWTVVQANLTPASIKSQYESNADTNALTDAEKTLLGNTSGTNSGDEAAASATVQGIVELATIAETDTGTDTTRAITPAGLAGSALQTKVNGIEALADVTDATNVAAAGATMDADTSLSGNGYFLDEDNMASDDATKAASQQSIKAYADTKQTASANLDEADTFFGATDITGAEAETLTDGSNADAKHKHSALQDVLVAGETMPASGPVAVRYGVTNLDTPETAGRVYKADPTELTLVKAGGNKDPFHVIGIGIAAAQAAAANIDIVKNGSITATAHGLAVGEPIFLDSAGALTSTAPTTAGEAIVKIGMAKDANTIEVAVQIMGVN